MRVLVVMKTSPDKNGCGQTMRIFHVFSGTWNRYMDKVYTAENTVELQTYLGEALGEVF